MALQLILGNSGVGISQPTVSGDRSGAVYHADSEGSGNDASAAWHHEY